MSVARVHHNSYPHDNLDHSYNEHAVLSIEEIRLQLYSCFTCGVSWLQDHVCLDCAECDGYSLQRPCLLCDGQCASLWKRDLTMSHACGKARWSGTCQLLESGSSSPAPLPTEEETRVSSHMAKLTVTS